MAISIPGLIDEFTRNNDDLKNWTETVFMRLCSSEESAQLLFNTLSYMEHIGSYKIMATQRGGVIDYSTLKHLNEETGHAVLFKRHAERISGNAVDYSPPMLLAPASARAYFNRLEVGMVQFLGRSANYRTIYLYMSMIVEFRAVWAYEILQECIEANKLDVSLERLLAEEQGHLYSMTRRLEADGDLSQRNILRFWKQERALYVRLLGAIDNLLDDTCRKVA